VKYLIASSYEVAKNYAEKECMSSWCYVHSITVVRGRILNVEDVILVDQENFTYRQFEILVAVKNRVKQRAGSNRR
jgi:hypothetical protein